METIEQSQPQQAAVPPAPVVSEPAKKSGIPTIAKVGCGCVVILLVLLVVFGLLGSYLFSTFGINAIQRGIESQTGVQMNTDGDGLTFTDTETGSQFTMGADEIPASFPSDFPIIPGAVANGSMSAPGDESGHWVVLSSNDSVSDVRDYYESQLPSAGWEVSNTTTFGDSVVLNVQKDTLQGDISISSEAGSETIITITLGAQNQ